MADRYRFPHGGLPGQDTLATGRAVFTDAYAVIPADTLRDIVTSRLPHWHDTRCWVLARPLTGFAETFSQYLMEVQPGGGSTQPEPDSNAEGVIFVIDGTGTLTLDGSTHQLTPGSYAFLAPGADWQLEGKGDAPLEFHWIRKSYEPVDGIAAPTSFVTHESVQTPAVMPEGNEQWMTTSFVDAADMAHDMHVNIVTLEPGAHITFAETHVMEHGLAIIEGKAVYLLNRDWVEVTAGDFLWLRAFCPQACYAGGPGPFKYLLYKDVNRHPCLKLSAL